MRTSETSITPTYSFNLTSSSVARHLGVSALSPGQYRFEMRASNAWQSNQLVRSVDFSVVAPFNAFDGWITTNGARVRASANTSATVLRTLNRNNQVRVIGQTTGTTVSGSNVWYQLQGGGYIHSSLVSRTRLSDAPPPTQEPPNNPPPGGSGWRWPTDNVRATWGNSIANGGNWGHWGQRSYIRTNGRGHHIGQDLNGTGGVVFAASAGTVVAVRRVGSEHWIRIRHTLNGSTVYSFYDHLGTVSVGVNDTVTKGQRIGTIFDTHVHFAIVTNPNSGQQFGWGTLTPHGGNFRGQAATVGTVRFYNPWYVINNNRLPAS